MIKYFVSGNEVQLSEDFGFNFVRENPFIDKRGDYTLDIDINLSCKSNSRLYAGIRRVNSVLSQPNRTAELWDGPRLLCRGTEVILSLDDDIVKVQLVGDNSQVNYYFSSPVKIRTLDLGRVTTCNPTDALAVTGERYRQGIDETYPVIVKADVGVNNLVQGNVERYNKSSDEKILKFDSKTELMPQPFFLAIVRKFFAAIGYELTNVDIDSEKYSRLIMIQNYSDSQYAKMLPDWTVEEFITEIERFFGVVCVFSSSDKTVRMLSIDKFYSSDSTPVVIPNDRVLDAHSVEYSDEKIAFQTSYQNVGYAFDGGNYWKLQCLSDDVLDSAEIVSHKWDYAGDSSSPFKRIIFYDEEKEIFYIRDTGSGNLSVTPRMVNEFGNYVEDDNVERNTMRIRPAKICNHYEILSEGSVSYFAPSMSGRDLNTQTFQDIILNGDNEFIPSGIDVAFFIGNTSQGATTKSARQECLTTYWNDKQGLMSYHNLFPDYDATYTLKLTGSYGRVNTELRNRVKIDSTKLYTFKFFSLELLDPKRIYFIKGRKFVCKTLQYSSVKGNFTRIVTGEFYPML